MNEINPNTVTNPLADEIAALEAQIASVDVTKLDPKDNGKVLSSPAVETKQPVVETKAPVEIPADDNTTDPIKAELERVKGQTAGKTPQEKFEYKLKLEAQRAKEMGIDVNKIFGITPKEESNDDYEEEDKPLTRKDLESILSNVSKPKTKSATEIAMETENEAERELQLYYLENVIKPSGDAQRAKEMGIDVNKIFGITPKEESNDDYEEEDKPLTRKDLESILSNVSKPKTKSATEIAMETENEAERELQLYYLENVIKPSGDAEQDFQIAKTMTDAIKLKNNATISSLKPEVKTASSASSFVPNITSNNSSAQLTKEEEMLFRDAQVRGVPFTKEEIIALRAK